MMDLTLRFKSKKGLKKTLENQKPLPEEEIYEDKIVKANMRGSSISFKESGFEMA